MLSSIDFESIDWVAIGAIAQATTGIIALLAAFIAFLHIRSAKRAQREATAHTMYKSSSLDIDRPDLATPDYPKLLAEGRFTEYSAYLSHLLWACQGILDTSADPTWRESIKYYLAFHADWIRSKDFNYGHSYYSGEIVELMRQAVADRDKLIEPYFRRDSEYRAPDFVPV